MPVAPGKRDRKWASVRAESNRVSTKRIQALSISGQIHAAGQGSGSFGFSIVTDLCLPDALEPVKLEDILAVANAAEPKLRVLVKRVVAEC